MTDIVSVYALFGSAEEAKAICRSAVEEGLAACANVLAPCHSLYRWEGRIEEATEVPAVLKTRAELAEVLIARIGTLHSYKVPAAVAWRIEATIPAYGAWVEDSTRPKQELEKSAV